MRRALADVVAAEKEWDGLPLFCWWPNRVLLAALEPGTRHAYDAYERRAPNTAKRAKKQPQKEAA